MSDDAEIAADRAYERALAEQKFQDCVDSRMAFNYGWNAVLDYRLANSRRNLGGQIARTVSFGAFLFGTVALLFTYALWFNGHLAQTRGAVAATVGGILIALGFYLDRIGRRQAQEHQDDFDSQWG